MVCTKTSMTYHGNQIHQLLDPSFRIRAPGGGGLAVIRALVHQNNSEAIQLEGFGMLFKLREQSTHCHNMSMARSWPMLTLNKQQSCQQNGSLSALCSNSGPFQFGQPFILSNCSHIHNSGRLFVASGSLKRCKMWGRVWTFLSIWPAN